MTTPNITQVPYKGKRHGNQIGMVERMMDGDRYSKSVAYDVIHTPHRKLTCTYSKENSKLRSKLQRQQSLRIMPLTDQVFSFLIETFL